MMARLVRKLRDLQKKSGVWQHEYDNHADGHHNGGFFFWYDQYGRTLAAKAVGDAASLEKQREIVLAIPEFDGCWVDSHELGRVYGTAMALLTLKLCEK